MLETEKSIQYFQWVKGDHAGKVVEWAGDMTVTPEGQPALIFKDGTSGAEALLNDYFMSVASPNEYDLMLLPETASPGQTVQKTRPNAVQYLDDGTGDVIIAKPPPGWSPAAQTTAVVQKANTAKADVTPIFKLLTDSRKTSVSINIELSVEVPGVELMKVLADSYADGEEQVLQYLAEHIDGAAIKQQVAMQIWQHSFNNKKNKRNGRKDQADQESTI